jgi:hypothetical protein
LQRAAVLQPVGTMLQPVGTMFQRVVLVPRRRRVVRSVAWPAHGIRAGHGLHGTASAGLAGRMLQRSINMLQRLTARPCRYRLGQRSQRSVVVGDIRIGLQARPRPHGGKPCRAGIPCRVGYHAVRDTVPRGIPCLGGIPCRVGYHALAVPFSHSAHRMRCAVENLRRRPAGADETASGDTRVPRGGPSRPILEPAGHSQ